MVKLVIAVFFATVFFYFLTHFTFKHRHQIAAAISNNIDEIYFVIVAACVSSLLTYLVLH